VSKLYNKLNCNQINKTNPMYMILTWFLFIMRMSPYMNTMEKYSWLWILEGWAIMYLNAKPYRNSSWNMNLLVFLSWALSTMNLKMNQDKIGQFLIGTKIITMLHSQCLQMLGWMEIMLIHYGSLWDNNKPSIKIKDATLT